VRNPPYFETIRKHIPEIVDICGARILCLLGDKITTDHISPAGSIPLQSAAASYLRQRGVKEKDFNQFGTRRGNHEVMMRGTFSNIRICNYMLGEEGKKGGYTIHYPSKEE
ncbi:aconitate hydratase, partial [Candidatus Liberibacter asiaticus]